MNYGLIGEIRLFGGSYAPLNWAFCDGSLITISSNEALYSILGTTYGGDGRINFALPDLRGRTIVGQGEGMGDLTPRTLGEQGGALENTLTISALPAHGHALTVGNKSVDIPTSLTFPSETSAEGNYLTTQTNEFYQSTATANQYYGNGDAKVNPTITTSLVGGQDAMAIMQPFLGMNYIICTFGIYPTQE
ncbi:MAG: tail fiber protein [Bacteroidota bacterium]